MTYINPGSFIPNMDFRSNPLQGAVAGQQLAAMNQLLDRSYRDSDQDYQKQQAEMDTSAEQRPFKLDVLKGQAAESKDTQAQIAAGIPMSLKQAELRKKQADADAEELKNKITKFQDQGDFMTQVADEYDKNPYQAVRDGPRWQKTKADAKERGIDLPDNPDPDFFQTMYQKSAAYQATRPKMIEKMAELKAQKESAESVARIHNEGSLAVAKENRASREEVANVRNDGIKAKLQVTNRLEAMATQTLQDVASEGVTDKNITRVEQAIEVLTEQQIQKDTGYSMQALQNMMSPEKLDDIREKYKDKVAQRFLGKSYKDYQAKKTLSDLKGSAPTSGDAKVPAPTSEAAYNALPKGAKYQHPDDPPGQYRTKN